MSTPDQPDQAMAELARARQALSTYLYKGVTGSRVHGRVAQLIDDHQTAVTDAYAHRLAEQQRKELAGYIAPDPAIGCLTLTTAEPAESEEQLSPDAKALADVLTELTTHTRRIANALATPVAVIRDGVMTPLADATTADDGVRVPCPHCSGAPLFRPAEITDHIARKHTGEQHPPAYDGPRCVCGDPIEWYTAPAGGAGWIHSPIPGKPILDAHQPRPAPAIHDDVTCRRMETRTCPPSYNGPCGERPCARFESEDPRPWQATDETPATDEDSCLTHIKGACDGTSRDCAHGVDEDAQRTARRASLHNLLVRATRRALSTDECATLWRHAETEQQEADKLRSWGTSLVRKVGQMRAGHEAWKSTLGELEQTRVDLQAQAELRADVQRDRDQHAAVLAEILGTFTTVRDTMNGQIVGYDGPTIDTETRKRWRSVVAPTVERPWWEQVALYEKEAIEATKHVLELKAVIERVRAVPDSWEQMPADRHVYIREAARVVRAALDDAEQPTATPQPSLAERLTTAIERAIYEYRERTTLWGETEGVTEEITRLAVQAALTALDESGQAPAEVVHPEPDPQASEPHTVDEQTGPAETFVQQLTAEVQL